jgi:cytochrome c-type biogenesis protein CcmH
MKILLLISILLISLTSNSSEVYTFNSQVDEQRFYKLIHEVRCPKCTSGSIASSNAPVSEDLKQKIAYLINQGYSDKQIKQYAKDRFGSEVLYSPEINSSTYVLWFWPFIFLVIILLIFFFRRKI